MPPLHKCSKRAFNLRKLITHVGLVHAHEPHFSITCGINDCQAAFSKYHSFRRHVYRKHKPSVLNSLEVVEDGFENHAHKEVEDPHTHSSDETHTVQQPTPPSMDRLLDNLGDHLFSFILKCTEKITFHTLFSKTSLMILVFFCVFLKKTTTRLFLIIWINMVSASVIVQNLSRFCLLQIFSRKHVIQFVHHL